MLGKNIGRVGRPNISSDGRRLISLGLDFTAGTTLDRRITFSRTSNATLTDSNGRVAYAPHNLLTNSESFEASVWTKVATCSVAANSTVAPDGTTTADTLSFPATGDGVYQSVSATVGTVYTASVWLWGTSNGTVTIKSPGAGLSPTVVNITTTPTRFSITYTATVTSEGIYILRDTAGQMSTVFAWGAQLNVANAPVNLLTFSTFGNAVAGSPGTAPTTWSIFGTGTLAVSSLDGTNNSLSLAAVGAQYFLFQTFTANTNTTYTISAYVESNTGLSAVQIFALSGAPSGSTSSYTANGVTINSTTYIPVAGDRLAITLVVAGTGGSTNVRLGPGASSVQTGTVAFSRPQINTGSTALPYVATTSSIYLPPSYNSTTPKNLLGFTQEFDNAAWTKSNSFVQTNLLTWSQEFNTAPWATDGVSITANTTVAPDNTTTADTITVTAAGGFKKVIQPFSVTNAVTYTFSSYVQAGTASSATLYAGGFTVTSATISGPGTLGATGSSGLVVTGLSTSQWTRVSITVTANASGSQQFNIYPGDWNTQTVGQSVAAWGAQLVQGSVPGDYQVTTSAAAAVQYSDPNGTRTADKLVEDTAASTTHRVFNGSAVTIPTTGPSANTIYAKAGERTAVRLTDNDLVGADFDLLTGAVSNIASGATATATSVGGGWWRLSVVRTCATANGRVVLYLLSGGTVTYTGDGTSGIYIWGAQLSNSASVDPYVYNPQAAPTSTAYYGPRFDYNPTTLAANGLLIEEQRTNLLTYSEQFDNAAWNKGTGGSIAANTVVAPDGTTTADAYTWATSTSAFAFLSQGGISGTPTNPHTSSIWLKRPTGSGSRTVRLAVSDITTSTGNSPDLTVTDSWQRFNFTRTSATNTGFVGMGLQGGLAGTPIAAGEILEVWGAQLEAGSFATSYIGTVASQVTRAADNASMLGDNFATWYNATEGTISSEASCFGLRAAGNGVVGISDGTTNNRFGIVAVSTNNAVTNYMVTGGVVQADLTVNSAAANSAVFKSAFGYKANDFASSVNGGAALTDTSGSIATVNRLVIGNVYDVAASNQLNGWVRRIAYYPVRLPAATLQSITS
jgi:hypothetical protein